MYADSTTNVLPSSMWMGLQEQKDSNLELCKGETLANGLSMSSGLLETKQNMQKFGRNG